LRRHALAKDQVHGTRFAEALRTGRFRTGERQAFVLTGLNRRTSSVFFRRSQDRQAGVRRDEAGIAGETTP
jgi:hypothetical protein